MSGFTIGRGGRPRKVGQKQRTSFKWTADIQYQMALYLRDHYAAYKVILRKYLRNEYSIPSISCYFYKILIISRLLKYHLQVALSSSRKIHFLRQMRDALEIPVDDTKLKNGFINFMRKFDEVRVKLNSSGFGIDPEKDATLQKGNTQHSHYCQSYSNFNHVLICFQFNRMDPKSMPVL